MAKTNYQQITKYLLTIDDSGVARVGIELPNGATHQIVFTRNDLDIYSSMADMLNNYVCYWDSKNNLITTNWV